MLTSDTSLGDLLIVLSCGRCFCTFVAINQVFSNFNLFSA